MTVEVSENGEQLVRSMVRAGQYQSESEVVDEALRLLEKRDSDRARAKAKIAALLIEALEFGPATPMTKEDWEDIRREGKRIGAEIRLRKGR